MMNEMDDDRQLVRRYLAGEESAFETLLTQKAQRPGLRIH